MTPDIFCIFCRKPERREWSHPFGGWTRKCSCGEFVVRPLVGVSSVPALKTIEATCSECPKVFPTRRMAPGKTCSSPCRKKRNARLKREHSHLKLQLPHVRPHLEIARTSKPHPAPLSVGVKRYGGIHEL